MQRKSGYETPFDSWLRKHGIKPLSLARKSGIARQTIGRLRRGVGRGTLRTRRDLAAACAALSGEHVTAAELFGEDD
jgi:transcriptional regulator with XRE-family HTH domain